MKRPKMSASISQWEKYRDYKKEQARKKALIKQVSKMK